MKFKIPMEGGDDEINMAPMIDMVFLLLIFFMVASHLTALERVKVRLPVADKAKVPEETPNRQIISVRLAGGGGDGVDIFMNLQKVTVERLAATLEELYKQDENLRVYLRADRAVNYKYIKEIMDACKEAGIVDIIFGTFESGD